MLSDQSNQSLALFLLLNTLSASDFELELKNQMARLYRQKEKLSEKQIYQSLLQWMAQKLVSYTSNNSLENFKKDCEICLANSSLFDPERWYNSYHRLSPQDRTTLTLSLVLAKPDDEVASVLSVSEGTVRYRVANSLLKMSGSH